MKLETVFSPGDTAWVISRGCVTRMTVGMVRVEIIDTPGVNGGRVVAGTDIAFQNYEPRVDRCEQYMMLETGIGTGETYTLGASCFRTQEAAMRKLVGQRNARIEFATMEE
jgi:hypothetical protein